MSFLESYPATSIFIACLAVAAIAGWVMWRRFSKPETDRTTMARFGFAVGVLLIVIGLIQTGMNIAQNHWNFDFSIVIGLALCWRARSSPHDASRSTHP
jgi:hypothetical protein